jgi:hypothetical protein
LVLQRIGTLAAAVVLAVALNATPAAAGDANRDIELQWANIDRQIAHQLTKVPGGRQVARNKIVWDKLGVVLEYQAPGTQATRQGCPYYYFCLYGDGWFNTVRPQTQPWFLQFLNCHVQDLGTWGVRNQASSWVNNQTPGTWGTLHEYRDEANTWKGYIQLYGSHAYREEGAVGIANDRVDVIDPC